MKFINRKQLKNPKSIILFIFLLLLVASCSDSLLNKEEINDKEETNKTDDDKTDDDKTDDDGKTNEPGVILTENIKMEFEQKDEYKWENLKKNFYTFPADVGTWTAADHEFWKNDVTRNRINLTYVPNDELGEPAKSNLVYKNREIGTDAQQSKNLKILFMAFRFIIHTKEFMEIVEHFYKTSAFANAFIIGDKFPDINHKYVDLNGKFYTSISKKSSDGTFEKIGDPRLSLFEYMTRLRSGFRSVLISKLQPNQTFWVAGRARYRTKFNLEKAIQTGEPSKQNWVVDHGWSADDNEINAQIPENIFNNPIIENDTDPNTSDDKILLTANQIGLFLHEITGHSLFNSDHYQDNYRIPGSTTEYDPFWKEFMEANSNSYGEICYLIDDMVKIFLTPPGTNKGESDFQSHRFQRIALDNNPTLGENHYGYKRVQMWKNTSDGFFDNIEPVTWNGQGGYYSELIKGKKFDPKTHTYTTEDKYTPIPNHYGPVPITPRQ